MFEVIDHRKQLFSMVANHRSSNAMFAIYCSSLTISVYGCDGEAEIVGWTKKCGCWCEGGLQKALTESRPNTQNGSAI